jgi:hypothetical protein
VITAKKGNPGSEIDLNPRPLQFHQAFAFTMQGGSSKEEWKLFAWLTGQARVSADVEVIFWGKARIPAVIMEAVLPGKLEGPTGRLDSHWLSPFDENAAQQMDQIEFHGSSALWNFSFHEGFELRASGQALVVAESGHAERAERRASLDRLPKAFTIE